jgi:hypothetical protein
MSSPDCLPRQIEKYQGVLGHDGILCRAFETPIGQAQKLIPHIRQMARDRKSPISPAELKELYFFVTG